MPKGNAIEPLRVSVRRIASDSQKIDVVGAAAFDRIHRSMNTIDRILALACERKANPGSMQRDGVVTEDRDQAREIAAGETLMSAIASNRPRSAP